MGTAENKKLMQQIFTDSANRSGTTFVDHLADDVCWIITGQWSWNRRLRPAQKICRCAIRGVIAAHRRRGRAVFLLDNFGRLSATHFLTQSPAGSDSTPRLPTEAFDA